MFWTKKSKFERFKEELAEKAKVSGICDEWYGLILDAPDEDALINLYVDGIDFSLSTNWLTPKYINKHFDKKKCANHGVYTDEKDLQLFGRNFAIFNGSCSGSITYGGFEVGTVYVTGDSEITIKAGFMSRVSVSVYKDAKVKVVSSGDAKVFVYRYDGFVETEGKVAIRDR